MPANNFSNSILDKIRNIDYIQKELMDYASGKLQDEKSNKNVEKTLEEIESFKETPQQYYANIPLKRDKEKIYPNDLCPCGSGKKYKKCCGKNKNVKYIQTKD